MMNSLIVLHPIFANTIPADDPNPLECVIHDVFPEPLLRLDNEEAAQKLSECSASLPRMFDCVSDCDVEMDDLPATYAEASYSSTVSEVFSTTAKPISPEDLASFDECYEVIDDMLTVDLDSITSYVSDNQASSSSPSLMDDLSDTNKSTNSDIEIPAPAALSIPPTAKDLQPQPLSVAVLPLFPNASTTNSVRTRPRGFTNPLTTFLSTRLAPTLASPKLDLHFSTKPRKRVHFHPNTSTRSFSPTSYAPEFITSTFSPLHAPSHQNDFSVQRQRKKARLHGERGRQRDRKSEGLRTYPRTCIQAYLESQHSSSPQPCTEHISLQTHHDNLLKRLKTMHKNFKTDLSAAEVSIKAPTVAKASKLLRALQDDLVDYLHSAGYSGHSQQQKMATCADTCDVATFEDTAQIFGKCLERLLLDFWTGERGKAEQDVEEALDFGKPAEK